MREISHMICFFFFLYKNLNKEKLNFKFILNNSLFKIVTENEKFRYLVIIILRLYR